MFVRGVRYIISAETSRKFKAMVSIHFPKVYYGRALAPVKKNFREVYFGKKLSEIDTEKPWILLLPWPYDRLPNAPATVFIHINCEQFNYGVQQRLYFFERVELTLPVLWVFF